MTTTVNATTTTPTHHISLTDGITTLGFILRQGNRIDPRAIERRPRQNGQYSPFTQSDWGSGRGIKDAQSDRSRYADGKRAITRHSGTVMLGGQETYTTGYRGAEKYLPGSLTWVSLLTTNRYIAYKFTCSANGNREKIYLWVRRRGTPTSTLTVELCSDNSGDPGTVLKTATATTTNITDTISQLYEFSLPSVQAVTATTLYWIKVYASAADDTTNYWQVGTDAADTNNLTKASSNGSTWSAAAYDLYFRIVDDTDQLGGLFFNYKMGLYFVTRPSGAAAPKLFINGDRGIATGTHSTTTIQDSTKTWTVNEWAGSIVYILSGTNSEWQTPYRTIASNTADTLTFSPAFPKASVTADTVYVILGSNKWTEISGHGLTVLPTSVISAGEICYFAQGDSTKMRRMIERSLAGVWTRTFAEEDNYATFLLTYKDAIKGIVVTKANNVDNSGRPSVATAKVEAWGKRLQFPWLINACNATTNWTFGTGTTGTADTTLFQTGTASIKMAITGAGANLVGYLTITAGISLFFQKKIRMWVYTSFALDKGVLKLRLSAATDASTSIVDIDLPALVAGEWQQVELPYADASLVGLGAVKSIGFVKTFSSGSADVYVDGIEAFPGGSEVQLGNNTERITGLELYGDPEVVWVFRQSSAGSVENGVFNPIPLREFSTAENVHNGMGHTVHNVYLYFSFLHGLERFYRNNLDDVGPNRDEGLPDGRRGYITSMLSYIGRFFYNYDTVDGYSAIFESTSGTDHHEIYRCDTAGKRIRNLFIQVVPGDIADRLWFTEGDDVCWLPLPGNTLKEDTDDTFLHTHEAVLETGWIYGAESDAVKLFSSVKLFTENTTSDRKIEWDYRTDESTAWTNVSTAFTTPPVQEVTLNVSAKRIRFRFRMQTNNNAETPQIRTLVVYGTTRPEIRYTYTCNTQADDAAINLEGEEDTSTRAATIVSTLDGWVTNNTVLTLRSVFSTFDNKTVFLEPIVIRPVMFVADESAEKMQLTLNMIEP